ncbi:hypothetical protein D3C80_974510 [compost metagenome]
MGPQGELQPYDSPYLACRIRTVVQHAAAGRATDAVQLRSPGRRGQCGDRRCQPAAVQRRADGRGRGAAPGGVQPGAAAKTTPEPASRGLGLVQRHGPDPAPAKRHGLGADRRCDGAKQRRQDPHQPHRPAGGPGANRLRAAQGQFAVKPGHACRAADAVGA